MLFLNINDPKKRDLIVKEYLDLKKNIRDNLLSERTGELELQTDLSKFFKPITKTQKATSREITEGLKPIKEGIDNLPQFITFPPTQPLREASGEEKSLDFGEIVKEYLKDPDRDTTFGIRNGEGLYYIGNKQATIVNNNIIADGEKFRGTPGLWELIMSKNPEPKDFTKEDYENYAKLMVKTNALYRNNNPKSSHPKSSKSDKWNLIRLILTKKGEYEWS